MEKLAKRSLAALLSVTLAVTGCSTAQMQQMKQERNEKLQKQYPSFSACFHEEKILAMAGGAILGGLLGKVVGGSGGKGNTVAALGAVVGGIIGNRIAWGNCLDVFAVKAQTTVIQDRTSTLKQDSKSSTQATAKSISIQNISASPLVFGPDLEIDVTYTYISDNPAARDIKAKISRSLLFKVPDGSQQEVPSVTEDTIQQGVSRSKFAIPTPSIQDAEELKSTTDWAFKFVVEVDGMRKEQIVKLEVPQLSAKGSSAQQGMAAPASAPQAVSDTDTISLKKGTTLFQAVNSTAIVLRLPVAMSGLALQRKVQGNVNWIQVRLPNGKEGWIKEARK